MDSVIDDETLQMYIMESKEHLEDIESNLLEIERHGEKIDEDLVNKVFRAAHSIKGGGGFLGLDKIKGLAHKIENILDMVRHFQIVPRPDVVNTVLEAFDYLGVLLDHGMASNDMDISDHVVALEGLAALNLAEGEKASLHQKAEVPTPDAFTSFTLTEFDLKQAGKGGKTIYLLQYDLIKDVQRQGRTPFDVMRTLDDAGIILDLKVGLASVGDLESAEISSSIPMYVLYASIIEPDMIGMVLDLEPEDFSVVPPTEEHAVAPEEKNVCAALAPSRQETGREEVSAPQSPPAGSAMAGEPAQDLMSPLTTAQPKSKPGPTVKAVLEKPAGGQLESLRVSVSVLDQLMNRAGELVLARNHLLQAISLGDPQSVKAAGQRINHVTSELQEAIMLTRMQPVGNIFNKFPRVVRDLARNLGKEMELYLEGNEVELDKAIIEGLADPLTHLVRNAADHGIEMPEQRAAKGKNAAGRIVLRAFHESGQVIIEIEDDGKGLDAGKIAEKACGKGLISEQQLESLSEKERINLIMLPGFSMAEKVTDVSGRGVGMDVVKTNLDKLGGLVEIHSEVDRGSVIRIKLPLTLAIIPSLLVASCGERFALPQVNVAELLRIAATEVRDRIDKVGDADVLLLRGELIPLLQLNNVLQLRATFYDRKAGAFVDDRRQRLADERLSQEQKAPAAVPERRARRESDVNIVVLQAGSLKYGIVIDEVYDTMEIVVKPLGRNLKKCDIYAGATIMGDGRVALILDVAGLARRVELRSLSESETATVLKADAIGAGETARQSLLFFRNGQEEHCAVPLHLVLRVEQIQAADIEIKGGKKVIRYRGGSLPVYALEEVARVEMLEERENLAVILFVMAGHEVGLLAVPPLDAREVEIMIDESTLKQPGISGSAIIDGKTTLLVDIFEFFGALNPAWLETAQTSAGRAASSGEAGGAGEQETILLVEDSLFFRAQVKQLIEGAGYAVVEAEDGRQAWEYLDQHPAGIALIVTDIEMPEMDGYALARRVKGDERLANLKVIALTSLASSEDMATGKAAGIDDYQIKLDKEKLVDAISHYLRQ